MGNGEYIYNKIADFLIRNHPQCSTWNFPITDWIKWFNFHKMSSLVWDGKEITGAAFARNVIKPEDGLTFYEFDPRGRYLFVDLAVATTQEAKYKFYETVVTKFAPTDYICFQRGTRKNKDRIITLKSERFWPKFLNLQNNYVST